MQHALQHVSESEQNHSFSEMPLSGKKEYRVITRVKNNLLLSAIEAAGYESINAFAEAIGSNPGGIGDLINFKVAPIDSNGDWRLLVHKICEALNKMPSQLFTETQARLRGAKPKIDEVSEAEAQWALEHGSDHNPEQIMQQNELRDALDNALHILRPREQEVLRLHYGLDCEPMSWREIGKKLGVCSQRAMQIHEHAIRILRSPHRGIVKQMKFLAS